MDRWERMLAVRRETVGCDRGTGDRNSLIGQVMGGQPRPRRGAALGQKADAKGGKCCAQDPVRKVSKGPWRKNCT